MPERTSWLALAITLERPGAGRGFCRFSFRRRKMFSTSTTASSTSSPMAIARPPSVMVLIDRPKALKTSTVIRIEIGMAVSEMSGRAHVHQEQEQHDGDHERRFDQHALRRWRSRSR